MKFWTLLLTIIITIELNAQIGGEHVYEFLNFAISPPVAAQGGLNVSLRQGDINLIDNNPALLDSSLDNSIALEFGTFVAGIKTGYLAYAKNINQYGTIATAIKYINYGKFTQAEPNGNITGEFSANELAYNILYSTLIDTQIYFGINIKPIYSQLYTYKSIGLAADIGIFYHSKDRLTGIGFVVKNFGWQITTYTIGNRETLPTDLVMGFSQRLQYAPFRFSLTSHYLQKFNLLYQRYDRPKIWDIGENILRHLIVGIEILPSKYFQIDLGFNYKRHQEMKIPGLFSSAGFSAGLQLNIKNFIINYSYAKYFVAANSHNFSIAFNLEKIIKSKIK